MPAQIPRGGAFRPQISFAHAASAAKRWARSIFGRTALAARNLASTALFIISLEGKGVCCKLNSYNPVTFRLTEEYSPELAS